MSFAVAGGWCSARVATLCSGRRFSVIVAAASCAVLAGWAHTVMGWTFVFAITLGLAWALLTLAAIDVLAFRLPDVLTLPLIAAGLLVSLVVTKDIWAHVAGAIIGYCVFAAIGWAFARVRGREGLGSGRCQTCGRCRCMARLGAVAVRHPDRLCGGLFVGWR